MKKQFHRFFFVIVALLSMSITFVSCDGLALVELPDAMYHDTTIINNIDTNYINIEIVKPDTEQRSPSQPYNYSLQFDDQKQMFSFVSLDSMASQYWDYNRESGGYTYLKTGQNTADLNINFTQRNNNTYYFDVYDLKLNFLTPHGGILNGTKTTTIKIKNPNTSEFTTNSTTITYIDGSYFSFTIWLSIVREGL